jgi:hypothetical protein
MVDGDGRSGGGIGWEGSVSKVASGVGQQLAHRIGPTMFFMWF